MKIYLITNIDMIRNIQIGGGLNWNSNASAERSDNEKEANKNQEFFLLHVGQCVKIECVRFRRHSIVLKDFASSNVFSFSIVARIWKWCKFVDLMCAEKFN